MSQKPAVFIGSSTEGLPVAEAVQALLSRVADVTIWTQVFELGKTTIESLMDALDSADFAVLVMTADDTTVSRKKKSLAPRDNVLFELGLFTGRLDRERCYFVFDASRGLKLPTDLLGVTAATYSRSRSRSMQAALRPACTRIRQRIAKLGRRPKLDKSALAAHQEFNAFCDRVTGCWWERVRPTTEIALSFVTIERDPGTSTVKIRGQGYGPDGNLLAPWESVASCVNLNDRKILYYWRGSHLARPAEPYEGFGEISFRVSAGSVDSGDGIFSDTNLTNLKGTVKKSGLWRRSTPQETQEMQTGDAERVSSMIRKTLRKKV